ncbi:MAG: hypothetical protein VB031_05650 [Eubacteriaceae bacterium]|nr:hypothetical protein [Eubacteriaceae bacterium]
MKKVIDGHLYDTQTAKIIAENADGAELYRTKSHRFFCYDGEAIFPVADPRLWIRSMLDLTQIELALRLMDAPTVVLVAEVPLPVKVAIQSQKKRTGQTYGEIITDLVLGVK